MTRGPHESPEVLTEARSLAAAKRQRPLRGGAGQRAKAGRRRLICWFSMLNRACLGPCLPLATIVNRGRLVLAPEAGMHATPLAALSSQHRWGPSRYFFCVTVSSSELGMKGERRGKRPQNTRRRRTSCAPEFILTGFSQPYLYLAIRCMG